MMIVHRKLAPLFEALRCGVYFLFDYYIVVSTPWQISVGERLVFDVLVTGTRVAHLFSIAFWLIRLFTANDGPRTVEEHEQHDRNSKELKLANGGKTELADGDNGNIELAKKIVSRRESHNHFDVQHLVASTLFVTIGFVILGVLYFVKVDSCGQFLNQLRK